MEFRFNVNSLFRNANVVKVTPNLTPYGFNGDRRQLMYDFLPSSLYSLQSFLNHFVFFLCFYRDMTTKMTEIINSMGEASARAQGLNKAVTTSQKLRNSDQMVYLLTDNSGQK